MRMSEENSPFLGILDSFLKLQPSVGILNKQEFRIPRTIQKMNEMEPNSQTHNDSLEDYRENPNIIVKTNR